MFRETLEVQKLVLGKEHPDTLNTAMNLANTLDDQGQTPELTRKRKNKKL